MKTHYDEKKCLITNIILQGVVCLNFNNVNIKSLIFQNIFGSYSSPKHKEVNWGRNNFCFSMSHGC